MNDKRVYDGMYRCSCKTIIEQTDCIKYVKHSHEKRCCFKVFDDVCDWHPHMACAKPDREPVKEREFRWPSKKEQEEKDKQDTNCGF